MSIWTLCMTTWLTPVFAQPETTQYFMNSVPQYVVGNPAFIPKYKFAFGLPGSSIGASYSNNGFSYNDLIQRDNDRLIADLTRWAAVLPDRTWITSATHADVLRLGIRISPKIYLTMNSTLKAQASLLIPKDLTSVLVNGTAPYIGKKAGLSPEIHGTSYWENAIGLALAPIENLTVGARVKMLKGFGCVQTVLSDFSLSVAENYEMTVAADMDVRTSGLHGIENDFKFGNYMKNSGWAVDLGATYQLMRKLKVAASILDIGTIHWKNDTYAYRLDKAVANYTFSGIEIDRMLNGEEGYLEAQADSLAERFTPTESAGTTFRSPIPGKVYVSGEYEIVPNFSVGAVTFAEKFQGRFSTGISVAVNKNFGRILGATLSYTASHRSFNNLGAGLSLHLAPLQLYIVGDNLLRLPMSIVGNGQVNSYINSTQVFNLRAGVNFVWGWIKTTAPGEDTSKSYNSRKKSSRKKKQVDPDYLKVRKKR